jgi:hypothetical protein
MMDRKMVRVFDFLKTLSDACLGTLYIHTYNQQHDVI